MKRRRSDWVDLTGREVGKLIVLQCIGRKSQHGQERWQCQCACGQKAIVYEGQLLKPPFREYCSRACPLRPKRQRAPRKEKDCWYTAKIKARQEGVPFCTRWRKFEAFLAAVGKAPDPDFVLLRRKRSKGYVPGNVFWGPRCMSFARRKPRYLTWKGETLHVNEWAERVGIDHEVLWLRYRSGWDMDDVMTRPLGQRPTKYRKKRGNTDEQAADTTASPADN
jgi:hypothetical protein